MNTSIRRLHTAGMLVALLLAPLAQAKLRDYRIDPVHSRVMFSVDHLGFSKAIGTFAAPTGWIRFDPDDPAASSAEVELDLRRLDLGDTEWNQRMARRDGFDSEAHPLARFSSQRIEPAGDRAFVLHGELHLRGARYPLELQVQFNRLARHPLTLRRTAGFSARATLSRAALGLDAWKRMVGDEVELRIEVEATRKRRPADAKQGATP